jgi:hypothetical protein
MISAEKKYKIRVWLIWIKFSGMIRIAIENDRAD